jgi:Do/DeqQ family serine protease
MSVNCASSHLGSAIARSLALSCSLLVVGASLAGCEHARASATSPPALPAPGAGAGGGVGERAMVAMPSLAPVVATLQPAIVTIQIAKTEPHEAALDGAMPPEFRRFFGGERAPRQVRGEGSGIVVRADGVILTNHHVVDGARTVQVVLADGRTLDGKVIGSDQHSDLAVVKVDAKDLATVALGSSAGVRVGDFAIAIGSPFGIGQSVTLGIISATGRHGLGINEYEDFIQTDAAINPGNSGGALCALDGKVIGINTALISNGGAGNQGVGLAIPIDQARAVMEQILAHGKVVRGYLGVQIQAVSPYLAQALGLPRPEGGLVDAVEPAGPAASAGIARGDLVLSINGVAVLDAAALRNRISSMAPGSAVELAILRGKDHRAVRAVLGTLPERGGAAEPREGRGTWGLEVAPLPPGFDGVPAGTVGVVIERVASGSAAEDAGLRAGDVIAEVDQRPVVSPERLASMLPAQRVHALLVYRDHLPIYVGLKKH